MVSERKTSRKEIRKFISDNLSLIIPDAFVKGDKRPNFNSTLPKIEPNGQVLRNINRICEDMTPSEISHAIGYSIVGERNLPEYVNKVIEEIDKEIKDNIERFEDENFTKSVINAGFTRLDHNINNYKNALYDLMLSIKSMWLLDSGINEAILIIEEKRIRKAKIKTFSKYKKKVIEDTKNLEESEIFKCTEYNPSFVTIPYLKKEDFRDGMVRFYRGYKISIECFETDRIKYRGNNSYFLIGILDFMSDFIETNNNSVINKSYNTQELKENLNDENTNILVPSFCDIKVTKISRSLSDSDKNDFLNNIKNMINKITNNNNFMWAFRTTEPDNSSEESDSNSNSDLSTISSTSSNSDLSIISSTSSSTNNNTISG